MLIVGISVFLDDDGEGEDEFYLFKKEYSDIREKYTTLKGNCEDIATIMIYMVGSDLESEGGFATSDLEEMLNATIGENVNIIVQTGGSSYWQNDLINADTCGRYKISQDGLEFLGDIGDKNMADANTVQNFIEFATKEYPADRYGLILWNHGGGTMQGYGWDERYDDILSLADLDSALNKASAKFDFIGFDACLMATIETAYMLEPYADYIIASEESEPGNGWYYTDWITLLSENTSIDTVTLGKQIIDDYINECSWLDDTTLSIVDLREVPKIYEALCNYMAYSEKIIVEDKDFKKFISARATARDFGEGEYEQVDIVDYVEKTGLEEGKEIIEAIKSAVKYEKSSVLDTYGLAMYFPYEILEYYSDVLNVINKIGIEDEYTNFFNRFVNIIAGGQSNNSRNKSNIELLTGITEETENYTHFDWYDEEFITDYSYEDFVYTEVELIEKGDDFVLTMTDDQWSEIVDIELQLLIDDGSGYIDVGSDSFYEFDEDGDLIVEFDGTWVALNGEIVPFYTEKLEEKDNGKWFSYGYVPCTINGEDKELIIYWSDENTDGFVAGYRTVIEKYIPNKGIIILKEGDIIQSIVDYYTYDGEYDASYELGEPITFNGEDLVVSYKEIGEYECIVSYMLTDIYQNNLWTESIIFQ